MFRGIVTFNTVGGQKHCRDHQLGNGKIQVSNALEKRGVTVAQQKKEWLEENPMHGRRPDSEN